MSDMLTRLRMKESASKTCQSTGGGGGAFQEDEVAGKIEKYLASAKSVTCQLV